MTNQNLRGTCRTLALMAALSFLNGCTTTTTDSYNLCALGFGVAGVGAGVASSGIGAVVLGTAGGGIIGYIVCDEELAPDSPEPSMSVAAVSTPAPAPAAPAVVAAPMAPAAEPVGDGDGDGVLDDTDECPDTPPGVQVDTVGCALPLVFDSRTLNFDFDSALMPEDAEAILAPALAFIEEHPEASFEIIGHTDSIGSDAYNLTLSESRAGALQEFLTTQGVDYRRLRTMGHGEAEPIADNQTEAGRAMNRRVELRLAD